MRKSQAHLTLYKLDRKSKFLVRAGTVVIKAERVDEDAHPILANPALRKKKGIRAILGRVFDEKGALAREIARGYDKSGKYVGEMVLDASKVKLDTIAQIKATLKKRPRHHEGIAPPLRKRIVAVVAKELMRARRLADIAKELGIPNPTLTRWTKGLPRKRPPIKKKRQ